MEATLAGCFNLDRIVEPYHPVPEIFATRCGYLEILPGPCLRMWCVIDHPIGADGLAGAAELRARVVMPLESLLLWRPRVDAWIAAHGVLLPAKGPPIIRPQGTRLM